MPPVINILINLMKNIISSSSYNILYEKILRLSNFDFYLKNVIPINKKCS